ncbi:unnamed protein product [Phaeothamnion confervicola]
MRWRRQEQRKVELVARRGEGPLRESNFAVMQGYVFAASEWYCCPHPPAALIRLCLLESPDVLFNLPGYLNLHILKPTLLAGAIQTWELACDISLHGCCCCDGPPYSNHTAPACPEWTVGEISDNAAAVLKLGAITVLLDVVFVLCSLVASLVLLDNLKGYQCEYL